MVILINSLAFGVWFFLLLLDILRYLHPLQSNAIQIHKNFRNNSALMHRGALRGHSLWFFIINIIYFQRILRITNN